MGLLQWPKPQADSITRPATLIFMECWATKHRSILTLADRVWTVHLRPKSATIFQVYFSEIIKKKKGKKYSCGLTFAKLRVHVESSAPKLSTQVLFWPGVQDHKLSY